MSNQPLEDMKNRRNEIQIKVENIDNECCYIWSTEKFNDKLLMMRDVVNTYTSTGQIPTLSPEDDPFFDYMEPLLIG